MNQPDSRLDHARLPDVSEPDDTMSNDTLTLGHHPTAPNTTGSDGRSRS